MQDDMQHLWDLMVDQERQPDGLGDFGFYDVEAVKRYAPTYIRSGYNPNTLPESRRNGSMNARFKHDLDLFIAGYSRTMWEYNEFQRLMHAATRGEGS